MRSDALSTLAVPAAPQRAWPGRWPGAGLALLAVLLFALTIPLTRLAAGSAQAPQLPVAFVAIGRAAVAGLAAALWLWAGRAPWPGTAQWRALAGTAVGVVFGFPLAMGLAVREVPAAHAAVVTGLLPLATAAIGAWRTGQRPGARFWVLALAGAAVALGYAALRGGARLHAADAWLLLAVLLGGWGYVAGARLSQGPQALPPAQVISWALVGALPLTLPLTLGLALQAGGARLAAVPLAAWAAFGYLALVSMWLGFFAWYRALARGGMLRTSQVQLLQPFLAMLLAVPLLGEALDALSLGAAGLVLLLLLALRRLGAAPPRD